MLGTCGQRGESVACSLPLSSYLDTVKYVRIQLEPVCIFGEFSTSLGSVDEKLSGLYTTDILIDIISKFLNHGVNAVMFINVFNPRRYFPFL